MIKKYFLITIGLLFSYLIEAQTPIADFNLPPEVCLEEQVQLENNSTNSDSFEWDFCPNDIEQIPNIELSIQNLGVTFNSFKLIKDGGKYYGFGVGGNSNLYRLDFGKSINSLPSISNLGTFGLLNSAQGIDIAKSDDKWVGFIGHFLNGGGSIVRLVWDSLESIPTAENIGNLGVPSRIPDVKIAKNSGLNYVFFSYYNGSSLIRLSLGNSLQNTVESSNIENITGLNDVQFPISLDILEYNESRFIIFASVSSKIISAFKFSSGWDSNINFVNSKQFSSLGNLRKINLYSDKNAYAFLSNVNEIQLIDLFQLGTTDDFDLKQNLNLPLGNGISVMADSGEVKLFGSRSGQLDRTIFENSCPASKTYSEDFEPDVNYVSPGIHPIKLNAKDEYNNSSIYKEITVTNNQAPDISFSTGANLCVTNPIEFNSTTEANITSYQWDFGDGNQSAVANPNHTYASAGTYAVKLSVTDAEGCQNLFTDSVSIFAEPVPDFQATAQGSICSQKPIVFENLTVLPTDATFFWDLGDGFTSTEENPTHVYAEAGDYIVSLSINMAGCVIEQTKTITVNPGPSVSFQYSNDCLGEILQFENTSQGDFLNSFEWDFGDGTKSTQNNPSHLYDTAGVYNVQLSAFTTNGCDFTISQEVEIQPLGVVAFDSEVACASQPTQFTEQVNITLSNITDYFWDFGISGTQTDISTDANPEFAFPAAGSYNVTLQITTSDGCTSTGSQLITVNSVPEATFEFEETCLDQTRLFSPLDTTKIITHFWELQNSQGELVESSQSANFSYLFSQTGTYQLTYRQENENLCSQSTTQTFTINEQPLPDFEWGNACSGEPIQFENLTNLNGNTLKSYSWIIGEKVISNDNQPQYTFEESGEYTLSLDVETQGGCVQSISKTIVVSTAPTALFELEQNVGAYPFALNLSMQDYPLEGIIGVSWTLNGDTISTTADLNHIIEEPGTYLLGLLLTNEAGCSDEHYEQIRVRGPSLDIALSNLRINKDDEFTSFILNISNRGSLVPERIDLEINLGAYSVTESLETPIYPENNQNISLSLQLTEEQIRGLSKICINATPRIDEHTDSNILNNRVCTNLESEFQVMEIYPNPAVNYFTIPLITPENDDLSISMEDSNGRQVKVFNYDLQAGYNELRIQKENLSAGIYFLRFRYQGQEKVKKIIFQ